MKYSLQTSRIRLISILVFLVAIILISKLYFVQIVNGEEFSDRADRQYLRPNNRTLDRGSIIFTTKDGEEIDAASLKTGYTISINPSSINYPEDTFNLISSHIDIDETDFFQKASKKDDPYEVVATRVDKKNATAINDIGLEGVSVYKEKWRFYPGKSLAAHTVGFMSYKEDELAGRYGLERQYENILKREEGGIYANFFVELFSGLGDVIKGGDVEGNVITTIEPTVQSFIEKEIETVRNKWGAQKVGAIVMNPKNGEIYGMALNPTFDLNTFNETNDISIFNNSLVEGVYEMGSIIKPLTLAIGIDKGVVSADTTYEDKGSMTLNGYTFYNHDKKVRGITTMQEVINKSLNTGAAFIVQKVGKETFSDYMKKLLNGKTGIDLPNEVSPLIANLNSKREIEHATASFGQGIAMSPINITRALSTLANGGAMVQPHIAKRIDYEIGGGKDIDFKKGEQIFKKETTEEVTRVLVKAVDEALLGGTLTLDNYSVAAKTGTAQIANKEAGGYYENRFLHSLFGYFPAYDPEFIVFLYIIEPKNVQFSSDTLPKPFMEIAKFLINYYELPPDR